MNRCRCVTQATSVTKQRGAVNVMAWPCHTWVTLLRCENLRVQREALQNVWDLSQQHICTSCSTGAHTCSLSLPSVTFASHRLFLSVSISLSIPLTPLVQIWPRVNRCNHSQCVVCSAGKQSPSGGGEWEVGWVAGREVSWAVQWAASWWDNKTCIENETQKNGTSVGEGQSGSMSCHCAFYPVAKSQQEIQWRAVRCRRRAVSHCSFSSISQHNYS